jgi:hypothetical protein
LFITGLTVLLGLSAEQAGGEAPKASDGNEIKSILPHGKPGEEACFEGTFSGRTIDMEDWAHVTTEEVPGLEVGGKPATRPVPRSLPGQDVSRVALHLTFQEKADTSFDYLFTVMTASKGESGELFARSGCAWSEKANTLDCWIECDGGSFDVARITGTETVDLTFSYLSMQAGCEGGGAFRIGTGESPEKISFRLAKAPLNVCKPLKDWDGEN